ncbi:MAG: hypothetical protein QW057_08790 [Candidatus Bathyarchaeia archaeon]
MLIASYNDQLEQFEEICEELSQSRSISEEAEARLSRLFPGRLSLAREAVEKEKVRRYVFRPSNRVAWTVVGHEREYEVLPLVRFCSCDDFHFKVLQGKAFLCYHLIAQRLAVALDRVVEVERPDCAYEPSMREWRLPQPGRPRPAYLEVAEDIRAAAFEALSESPGLTSRDLHQRLVLLGFEIPSARSLGMVLWADPRGRFRHVGRSWFASDRRLLEKGV